MENKYLAKTKKEKTIQEHTFDLLRQFKILYQLYPNILNEEEWKILEYAVKYHDLGKMNTKFQNKLYSKLSYPVEKLIDPYPEEKEVPHNFLSPFFINTNQLKEMYGKENTKILLTAVYCHHSRETVKYEPEHVLEDLRIQLKGFDNSLALDLEKVEKFSERYLITNDTIEDILLFKSKKYIMIKGLLNKLDYVASLDKDGVNVEEQIEQQGKCIGQIVSNEIEEKYQNQFRPVQLYMKENKEENLIVSSPTGSGKTEACLLWIGNHKAFYTLPLKVSINAIYQRIYEEIGYRKALLLHSDVMSYYRENETEELNAYDRARRMSSPLLVTTVDQLFKIAFRYGGYEEILSTLSYAKVIIDEIQMYSPKLIAYILLGLKMLTQMGGKFAIVTATFPPLLYHFMDYLEIPYKKQEEEFIPHLQERHKIAVKPDSQMDLGLIKEKSKNHKVLVIVNTIKKAQEIYEQLKGENTFLLHAQYLKKDRDLLEKSIMSFSDRLQNTENGIWISTQIVEASLDIDFDVLFTDMCTIDSLFQRMGRVYRKRKYDKEEANVYIYDNKNGGNKIVDTQIYQYSFEEVRKYDTKLLSEQDKQTMIKNVFDLDRNPKLKESNYYNDIKDTIRLLEEVIPNEIPKKEVQNLFRDIQSVLLIPDNIYEELEKAGKIEEWNLKMNSKLNYEEKIQVKEEINYHTISVTWNYKLEYDAEELFFMGSNIHRTSYQYEFNEETRKGRGLIKEAKQYDNFDD